MTPFQRKKALAGFKVSLARARKDLERDSDPELLQYVDSETSEALKLLIARHRGVIESYEKLIAQWERK